MDILLCRSRYIGRSLSDPSMLVEALLASIVVPSFVGVRLITSNRAPVGRSCRVLSAAPAQDAASLFSAVQHSTTGGPRNAPEVIIAGGGIGGLCTALVLSQMGYSVRVFEKTREYRAFGGPIQIASNAAESIRRIDVDVYQKILASSTVC